MNSIHNKGDEEVKAPDAHSHTAPGAEGWKDVLQLLKEQSVKMEQLARALSVIQQGMLRSNPEYVKNSVSEATEVLSGMLKAHKCLPESGEEIQKRLESHPASKRMGISRRPRSASLGDTPKKLTKGEKKVAPSPPKERIPKKGKGSTSPSYAAPTRSQTPQKDGEWNLVEKMKNKRKIKRRRKEKFSSRVSRRSPDLRSADAIRVSAKDGKSYAEILKAMKAKVNLENSGAEVLSIRRTRKEEILLVLKKEGEVSAFEKALDQAVGQRAEVKSLDSKGSLEVH